MARFHEFQKESGGDDELPTPWMMVPLNGFNVVVLDDENLSAVPVNDQLISVFDVRASQPRARNNFLSKLRARSGSPEVAQLFASLMGYAFAFFSGRIFIVTGESIGDTIIKANDGKRMEKARLDVSVKRRSTKKVAFNFVRHKDQSGKIVNHTSNDPSAADQWIDVMNNIFTPQTNIVFEKHAARWVTFNGTLDRIVRPQDTDTLFKERDPTADMNIFIVGEYESDRNRKSTADLIQGETINYQNIICEDKTPDGIATTMAHEALHFLLREGHHEYTKEKTHWLMEQVDTRTGHKIPKGQANKVNPTQSTARQKQRK